jgi:hypothetical protein
MRCPKVAVAKSCGVRYKKQKWQRLNVFVSSKNG